MTPANIGTDTKDGRLVLIADDEYINRELLGSVVESDYRVVYAEDGEETLACIRENAHLLSLVLLDLNMPKLGGLEILGIMRADPEISKIPVIVVTSDHSAEIECLDLGAVDFIPKPYPQPGVILARVRRVIELFEDRQIISSTEKDPLTGLYNKEYFYRYAERFDMLKVGMDAAVIDVNHFHIINDRFGMAYGDMLLRRVGEKLGKAVRDAGGIACRKEADTFLVYVPDGTDHKAILDAASAGFEDGAETAGIVRLRMGVYRNADRSINVERRFDRAKMASDMIKGSVTKNVEIYDEELREKELYAERLVEDFRKAIDEEQFKVYYQPKFSIVPDEPVLASAEALVRWQHPELGMISPAAFIPLFEENGLIQELDRYVWRTAAKQISDWKKRLGSVVPVSVNVSRIDLYDPDLAKTLSGILDENGITARELLLEVTESAYTEDSERIIDAICVIRNLGFRIEMDDFGSGYSSLNMISALPIDALKLDMKFIRTAFSDHKDTRMIEAIVGIAGYLSVPVIAEGVETEEQMLTLKAIGCDIVQGYYFSKPVPASEFEKFIVNSISARSAGNSGKAHESLTASQSGVTFSGVAKALSKDYLCIYYVDLKTGRFIEYSASEEYERLGIEKFGDDFFAQSRKTAGRLVHPEDRERFLTEFSEENVTRALKKGGTFTLTYRLELGDNASYFSLKAARMDDKDDWHIVVGVHGANAATEFGSDADTYAGIVHALAKDYFCIYCVNIDNEEFIEYDSSREYDKLHIEKSGKNFFEVSRRNIKKVVDPHDKEMFLSAFTKKNVLNELKNGKAFTLTYRLMFDGKPTYVHMKATKMNSSSDNLVVIGVSNIDRQMLREEEYAMAMRIVHLDALTGVKSKHAYDEDEKKIDRSISKGRQKPFAVAVCDVNDLKRINDTFGHKAGDKYLCSACTVICNVFKHSPVYRVGGDEFAVVLQGRDYENREALVKEMLSKNGESLAEGDAVIAACGIADYDAEKDTCLSDVFVRADLAMYANKRQIKKDL